MHVAGVRCAPPAETARSGVRVNALCPGPVPETRMSQELGQALATRAGIDPQEMFRGFLEAILQGRAQTADQVAAAALFLCFTLKGCANLRQSPASL